MGSNLHINNSSLVGKDLGVVGRREMCPFPIFSHSKINYVWGPILRNAKLFNIGMLKLRLQYFGHLMQRANSEKTLMLGKIEGKRRRGRQKIRWLDGITDSMDMSLSKLREIVKDWQAWHAVVHGAVKSQTRLSAWTTTNSHVHLL